MAFIMFDTDNTLMRTSVIGIVLFFLNVIQACRYPDFVQTSHNERRVWHSHVTERSPDALNKNYTAISHFYGHKMITSISGGKQLVDRPEPYTRECVIEVNPGKYLSSHRDKGNDKNKYLCISFLKRSNHVFQLKLSKFSDIEDPNLCHDDKLVLDDWPFVNWATPFTSYEPCGIVGGFNIKIFDKTTKRGVCDAYSGETRLESECERGDGLNFRFRYKTCIPEGLENIMDVNQKTHCMATWRDERHMFTILRHEKTEHWWCLRYSVNYHPESIMYFFRNLHCVREAFPSAAKHYLKIDMTEDDPRSLSNLCMDDYEACQFWSNPCADAGSVQLTCAQKCKVCDEDRPQMCDIPDIFRGVWIENEAKQMNKFFIQNRNINIANKKLFTCVEWENVYHDPTYQYIKQMFVTTYDNGCKPRYSCIEMKKNSPSVLRYKVSESQIWPFDGTSARSIDCYNFKFKDHYKTLISESERVFVDCLLGSSREFDVIYNDSTECSGELTQDGLSTVNKMKLVLNDCQGHQPEQEFACLDSSKGGYLSEQLIVTETLDTYNRIRCWLFPIHPQLTFYLLPMSECNQGASGKITRGDLTPIATFKQRAQFKLKIIVEKEEYNENNLLSDLSVPYNPINNMTHEKDTPSNEEPAPPYGKLESPQPFPSSAHSIICLTLFQIFGVCVLLHKL